jgi:hypothetical protein
MRPSRRSTLLAVLIAIGCNGFVGEATVNAPAAEKSARSMTALDRARAALNRRGSGEAVGDISLAGYSFSRELEIGEGLHVIVISSNLAGGLAVFRGDGSAVVTQPTREITWVQLFDLDEDGVSEIVTEEIDGRGTGVLEKTFRVYRVTANQVVEIWSGQSFRRHAPDENRMVETSAFLRFDRSGAGRNGRLTHLTVDASHQQNEAVYEWREGALHRTPQ